MKKFAALVFVLFISLNSMAQVKKMYQTAKQALTGSAKLAELHYFPEPWEVDLTLGYRFTNLNLRANSAGTTFLEAEQKLSTLSSTLVLGVLDQAYLQLNWDYMAAMDVTYTKPSSQPSTTSKGFEDPIFSAVVRLLDSQSVKLDSKLAFQPSTGDHLEPDANHDGDAKAGGHAITVGGRFIALVTDHSQLSATIDYKMLSLRNSMDQTTGVFYEDDKHNQTLIEIGTLTGLTSDLFFGANLEIVNVDSYKQTNVQTRSTTNYGSVSGKTLNLIGKYQLTADSLIEAQGGYVLDYTQDIQGLALSATGYNAEIKYTVRF